MKKTIITVVGKDTVGIIAKVCTYLAENQINIEDISQTIVSGYFNMMMVVDMNHSKNSAASGALLSGEKQFAEISEELEALGNEIGVIIKCQREEIFDSMHRV